MVYGVSSMRSKHYFQRLLKMSNMVRDSQTLQTLTFVGRAWTVEELRRKSFHDVHKLWWNCLRENNRLLTEKYTRMQLRAGYGNHEAEKRIRAVHKTQKAIRQVLVERWDAWEDAREMAEEDPDIQVTESGTEFAPVDRESNKELLLDEAYAHTSESTTSKQQQGTH
jgi:large subunit ribosomal protein L47